MLALVANQLLANDYEFYACALEDERFISSELRKVGKTWTFPVLLKHKIVLAPTSANFPLFKKHKIIREWTCQQYRQGQAKFSMRGGPIRECAVLTGT